jgi:hypothetical protein
MTTQNKLEEIKARLRAFNFGPLQTVPNDYIEFINNAPKDITYLLALVEKYRAALNNIYNTGTNGESYATIAGDSHRIARQALEEKAE